MASASATTAWSFAPQTGQGASSREGIYRPSSTVFYFDVTRFLRVLARGGGCIGYGCYGGGGRSGISEERNGRRIEAGSSDGGATRHRIGGGAAVGRGAQNRALVALAGAGFDALPPPPRAGSERARDVSGGQGGWRAGRLGRAETNCRRDR